MGLRTLTYHFRHALTNIFGNRLVNAINIGTMSISLLLFGSFMLLFVNFNNWVMQWGQSLSMSVYLRDGIDEKAKDKVKSILNRIQGTKSVNYISKDQAMMDLTEGLGIHSGLLEGLDGNPLPASFEVVFEDVYVNRIDPKTIKQSLQKMKGVEEVQYSEQWLERFEGLISILKGAGFIIGGLLCLAVLFIVTNTIKLTIYSRREEIEIIKLVGATDWFVKLPFLIEGALHGLFSGLVSLVILFSAFSLFALKKVQLLGLPVLEIAFLPSNHILFILTLGLVLGVVGSLIAVGRFFN